MPDDIDDSLVKIANSIDAHRTDLRNVISGVGDKLAHEIQKLQDVISGASQVMGERSTNRSLLHIYQIRLESLALAFKPCHEICLNAISDGKVLNDNQFKAIVRSWEACKEDAYVSTLIESENLLKTYNSLEELFRKLQADGTRIDDEIRNSSRNALIDALNNFNDSLHRLLSSVKKQSEYDDTASFGRAAGGTKQ